MPEVHVAGADRLAAGLGRVAAALRDCSDPGGDAGRWLAERAAARAPRRTGTLARSVRVSAVTAEVATVEAAVRYAAVVDAGSVRRRMTPTRFLTGAGDDGDGWVDPYADHLSDAVDRVRGA